MNYSLPCAVEIDGTSHNIRNKGDYRTVLDVIAVLNDPDLNDREKAYCSLQIFYEDADSIKDNEKALREMFIFVNLGVNEDNNRPTPRLMDWEQDFNIIVAPVNRIIGKEIRSMDYLHWWSFISAYYEIGDCCFANVVSIRKKLKTGKKLEKYERDYYRDNKSIIDLHERVSTEEQELIDSILNG